MKYIECPQNCDLGGREKDEHKLKTLFLAGGISGCGNWQTELTQMLENLDLVVINPRRKNYNTLDPLVEREQITWEYNYLRLADAVSFWFPSDTLCPITLYELGKCSVPEFGKKLFIGVDSKYARIRDIEIQTQLIRPEVKIVNSLEDLAAQIANWSKTRD